MSNENEPQSAVQPRVGGPDIVLTPRQQRLYSITTGMWCAGGAFGMAGTLGLIGSLAVGMGGCSACCGGPVVSSACIEGVAIASGTFAAGGSLISCVGCCWQCAVLDPRTGMYGG